MTNRKNILILKFSNISNQPRIYRQIEFLKDHYNIYTAAFKGLNNPHIKKHFDIKIPFLPTGLIDKFLWNISPSRLFLSDFFKLNNIHFDLIIAHDPYTLQTALQLSKKMGAKVLHDAHEYTPGQYEDVWYQRLILLKIWDCICRKHMPHADATVTVCQGIADEYERNYGVHCEVIDNAPFFNDLSPSPIENQMIKMIHHGTANPSRRTEDMIHLMELLDDRLFLDFMLMDDDSRYYKKIRNLGQQNPRISFRDPVPMPDISKTINKYDIGLFLLSPETFSYRMALPNKLFEFIQGRLAVATWPSPEMARCVRKYDCGVVSSDFTIKSIASKLNALSTEDIVKYKVNSHKAAGHLCAEKNRDLLLNIVEKLLM
ncbi:MAG: glycosyltransferase [Deltaproteobacteria bacterium]|nr:glycosyltransferase [Deltaproteobacteria bacterium]